MPKTGRPLAPKQFADLIGRSDRWVCEQIAAGTIPTCPPHLRPYLIPRTALAKFGISETAQ